jgi:hypothetical protein
VAQYKRNFSICDAPCPARPKLTNTRDDEIQELILEERWISAKSVAEELDLT